MATRRGNPNWGKSEPMGPVIPTTTEFERITRELKLQANQYIHSTQLREWASLNKNSNTSPNLFLRLGGIKVEPTL